jgi:hypothetical protein
MGRACSTNGAKEECIYMILGGRPGRPEGKRLLGRPRCRWVDNIIWTRSIWFRIGTSGGLLWRR